MKYYRIYTIAAVFVLVIFVGFVGLVCFWPEPQMAGASPVPQKADVKQALNSESHLAPINFAGLEDISNTDVSESDGSGLFALDNSIEETSVIEIEPGEGQRVVFTPLAETGNKYNISGGQSDSSFSSASAASGGTVSSSGSSSSGGGSGGGSSSSGAGSGSSSSSTSGSTGASGGGVVQPDYSLPEWIEKEGIRAGFFSSSCDTNYSRKMKAVGLNTAITTRFCYDLKHLPVIIKDYRSHAEACERADMHMFAAYAWQPGGQWTTPRFRSVVFADGSSGLFPCPLDENFWQQHLINLAVRIAGISIKNSDSIIDGIFLDMEMYGTETQSDEKKYYTEDTCFCDFCFSRFILDRTQIKDLPLVSKDRRKSWLSQNGYLPDYYAYLKAQVESKAELLKNDVHQVNPKLMFGVYPALSDANWVLKAVMRAFGRNSYPVISFTTDTYGYYLIPWGADRIPEDLPAYFKEYNINGIYVAGYMFRKYNSSEIDSNLIKSCQRAQGYWLFNMSQLLEDTIPKDNPLAGGTQTDYLRAIQSANAAVRTR